MLGFEPPPVATASVLEIGCAAGGHIIPLADRKALRAAALAAEVDKRLGNYARIGLLVQD